VVLSEEDFPHEQLVQQEQHFLAGAWLTAQAQPDFALQQVLLQAQALLALQQVSQHLLLHAHASLALARLVSQAQVFFALPHAHASLVLAQLVSQAQAFFALQQPLSQVHDFLADTCFDPQAHALAVAWAQQAPVAHRLLFVHAVTSSQVSQASQALVGFEGCS
jgi:hypothetical protein